MFKRRGTIVQKLEDVEGPIRGSEVMLKSHAHVVGDIQCQHLSVERCLFRWACSPQTKCEQRRRSSPLGCVRKMS
jgi:cytoskeletal protein CcmA (bactofilin family)